MSGKRLPIQMEITGAVEPMLTFLAHRHFSLSVWALVVLLSTASLPARADIDSAFENLLGSATNVSVNEPGNYRSQARNSFVLGGADIRFPSRRSPTLYSVTPFSLNAGCGGISVFFGGFSFISGDEIKQLIESVARNSVGVAIELVMTTLCGPCAHVMQVMRSLAKDAARTAIDSCEMARSLMERGATKVLGPDRGKSDKDQAVCASTSTSTGESDDWIAAVSNGLCNSVEKAVSAIENITTRKLQAAGVAADSSQGQAALCAAGARCNTVWSLLNQTNLRGTEPDNVRAKLILMNVIGTNLICGADEACKATASENGASDPDGVLRKDGLIYYPPRLGNVHGSGEGLDMQDVFSLYMCGTNYRTAGANAEVQAVIDQYCDIPPRVGQSAQSIGNRWIWDCDNGSGGANNRYGACLQLVKLQAGTSALQGNGYLPYVVNLMQRGVEAVRTNSPIPVEVIQLIQLTPIPLYQAINAAAVYPDAGAQLVAVMSTYVAQLLTYADLRDTIREAERLDQNLQFSAEELDRVFAFLGGMRATTDKAQRQIAQSITMQQTLMEQIRAINLAIQREVMSSELLGAAQFGTAITGAAQSAAGGSSP